MTQDKKAEFVNTLIVNYLRLDEEGKGWFNEKVNGWISVKDRLPEFGSQVLAIIPKKDQDGFFNAFSCDYEEGLGFCDMWSIENDDRYYRSFNENVTHWMPLPEPPKQ